MPVEDNYRIRFRKFLSDPANGMMLDASTFRNGRDNPPEEGAAFLTGAGRWQRHFLTIWPLFGKTTEFDECLDKLAEIGHAIRGRDHSNFDLIVTCTASAKHLMEHLHGRLDDPSAPIDTVYLGPFPYQNVFTLEPLNLEKRKVLILTDVVSSGTLVKHLARVVPRLNGHVHAILCVAKFADDAADLASLDELSDLAPVSNELPPVYAVTNVHIRALKSEEYDPDKVIHINTSTVLPEDRRPDTQPRPVCFPRSEMLEHFEESKAIRFSLFETDGRRFTTAVRFEPLFEMYGHLIREKAEPELRFADGGFVVTTFAKDDLTLWRLLNVDPGSQAQKRPTVFIPRVDFPPSAYPHYFPTPDADKLEGKPVVLILAAIRSSDKVVSLVSLLAQQGVASIHIVCLLNRLAESSDDFFRRINHLIRGVRPPSRPPTAEPAIPFSFKAIYWLPDFESDDMQRAQASIENLADGYRERTRDHGFRALMQREAEYFRPDPVTGHKFENTDPKPPQTSPDGLADIPEELRDKIRSEDGILSTLAAEASRTREYLPLARRMAVHRERTPLYRILQLLVAEISYLRSSKQFGPLRRALVDALAISRKERYEIESSLRSELSVAWSTTGRPTPRWCDLIPEEAVSGKPLFSLEATLIERLKKARTDIEDRIIGESNHLFSIAILSFLDFARGDEPEPYREIIATALVGGLNDADQWAVVDKNGTRRFDVNQLDSFNVNRWDGFPENCIQYYGNERVAWVMSALLHFTELDYRQPENAPQDSFVARLRTLVPRIRTKLSNGHDATRTAEVRKQAAWYHLGSLLGELRRTGEKPLTEHLRYLQSQLLRTRARHNPMFTAIQQGRTSLEEILIDDIGRPIPRARFPEGSARLTRDVEFAIFSSARLDDVVMSLKPFLQFHVVGNAAAPDQEELARYVQQVRDTFLRVRQDKAVSRRDTVTLQTAETWLKRTLGNTKEFVVTALKGYISDLGLVHDAVNEAKIELRKVSPNVPSKKVRSQRVMPMQLPWDEKKLSAQIQKLEGKFVLIDPLMLKEILRNLIENLRHGAERQVAGKRLQLTRVEVRHEPGEDPIDPVDFWKVRVWSLRPASYKSPAANSTFNKQAADVRRFYGGKLVLLEESDASGQKCLVAELSLISRDELQRSLKSDDEQDT